MRNIFSGPNITRIILLILFLFNAGIISCKKNIPLEKEPNDSIKTATPVEVNSIIQGYMNTESDRDYYNFTLKENIVLSIELSGLKGINLAFSVFKSGNVPELLKLIDDNRKSSPERMLNLFLYSGDYFIVVTHGSRDPKRKNIEIPYTLEIKTRLPETEEIEPNDRREQSTPLKENENMKGYFSPRYNWLNESVDNRYREEDFYKININPDIKLPLLASITVTGVDSVNSKIYLYNSIMKLISESVESESGRPSVINSVGLKEPGEYYILVAAKKFDESSQPYFISFTTGEYNRSSELEPNNTPANASTIEDNRISGNIGSSVDTDFFRYKSDGGATGKNYRLELVPESRMDLMMKVYNTSGVMLLEVNNTGLDETEVLPNFFSRNDFVIEVYSRSISEQEKNNYSLLIKILDDVGLEKEPNDNKENANTLDEDIITGYVSKKRDIDYFLITEKKRMRFSFHCTAPADGKIKVSITDPLGYIIKSVDVSDAGKATLNEMIDRKGFLIIESIKDDFNSPYVISISEDK